MDSLGGYDCYGDKNGKSCISKDAVQWFKNEIKVDNTIGNGDLIFTTYPLPEFMELYNSVNTPVYGLSQQEVCCQAQNTGLFEAALQSKEVGWIVAGSDANNDWQGNWKGVEIAYGRKSGYGGRGDLPRGARVLKVNVDNNIFWTQTWIRDIENDVYDYSKKQ